MVRKVKTTAFSFRAVSYTHLDVYKRQEAMCEVGALATLSISYYDLGAKAAEMAYDILVNGKKPAEMPIEYLTDGLVPKYNADIAEALGVTIPEGMEPVA